MTLAPGARLGPYEIVSPLGAGGMGEVYKARDTRLERTVAIKILPDGLVADQQTRDRFEREARTLSRIDHPHICALFDVGNHEGTGYLVMQYLEGETLAARLTQGPLPVDQALRVGIEICDALTTAHRHGIVHRDLKPANIMLTKSGARLLDFGVARDVPVVSPAADVTMPGTRSSGPLTGQGIIVGTVHYMSPEQLRGKPADARSDIYALGVVLYEMLAGRRPFDAADTASLIAAILEREPPALDRLGALSPRLERALRTALEKDPEDRWQSSRDLRRELQWLAEERPAASHAASPARPKGLSRRSWIAGGASLAALALAALGAWAWLGAGTGNTAPSTPVIVLMDSPHPARVYDPATLKVGGTNADDLTDLLRDLPVGLLKETTGTSWRREDEILRENPAMIVAHRSCFYDATLLGDAALDQRYVEQLYAPAADKFEMLLAYVALGNPRTRFLVYSRGSWETEADKRAWIAALERRFPRLKGRVRAYKVPLDRATFRHPQTGAEIKAIVTSMLNALPPSGDPTAQPRTR